MYRLFEIRLTHMLSVRSIGPAATIDREHDKAYTLDQ